MGTMTLTDFQQDVLGGVQRPSFSDLAKVNKWINNAIKEFAYAFKFRELEAVANFNSIPNQIGFTIGTDIGTTRFRAIHEDGLRITGPASGATLGRMIPETRPSYLKLIGDTADTTQYAQPRYYHKFNNKVYTRPIPDSVIYTIDFHYWQRIVPLAGANDVSQFDEDWDEAILVGAMYRAFRYFGEFDRYQNVRADFLGIVRSRQMEYDLEEFPEGAISPTAGATDQSLVDGSQGSTGPFDSIGLKAD